MSTELWSEPVWLVSSPLPIERERRQSASKTPRQDPERDYQLVCRSDQCPDHRLRSRITANLGCYSRDQATRQQCGYHRPVSRALLTIVTPSEPEN